MMNSGLEQPSDSKTSAPFHTALFVASQQGENLKILKMS